MAQAHVRDSGRCTDLPRLGHDEQVAVPTSAHNAHHAKTDEERRSPTKGCKDAAPAAAAPGAGAEHEARRTVTMKRAAGHEMAWCGLLLDTRTLEVRRDFGRYAGGSIRDAVTIAFDSKPGQRLRDRAIGAVKSKLLPILLDASVNSPRRVRYNIYQVTPAP